MKGVLRGVVSIILGLLGQSHPRSITPIRILGLSDEDIKKVLAKYPGVNIPKLTVEVSTVPLHPGAIIHPLPSFGLR
ncbi:MAG: hypothetical protein HY998_04945 [candidate division NC10 bacterium]|nr:hypothetical protein [candidate division NC10 bacterium]